MNDMGFTEVTAILMLHGWTVSPKLSLTKDYDDFGLVEPLLLIQKNPLKHLESLYSGQTFGNDAKAWLSYLYDRELDVRLYLEVPYGKGDKEYYLGCLDTPPMWSPEYYDAWLAEHPGNDLPGIGFS